MWLDGHNLGDDCPEIIAAIAAELLPDIVPCRFHHKLTYLQIEKQVMVRRLKESPVWRNRTVDLAISSYGRLVVTLVDRVDRQLGWCHSPNVGECIVFELSRPDALEAIFSCCNHISMAPASLIRVGTGPRRLNSDGISARFSRSRSNIG